MLHRCPSYAHVWFAHTHVRGLHTVDYPVLPFTRLHAITVCVCVYALPLRAVTVWFVHARWLLITRCRLRLFGSVVATGAFTPRFTDCLRFNLRSPHGCVSRTPRAITVTHVYLGRAAVYARLARGSRTHTALAVTRARFRDYIATLVTYARVYARWLVGY